MKEITRLLERAQEGDVGARDELFAMVYAELNRLARAKLAREATLTNLDATALVHEAYLRLSRQQDFPAGNRRMFFGYSSRVMRSVIVDYVRERGAHKRGGSLIQVTLTTHAGETPSPPLDAEALEQALAQLAQIDDRAHRIVELRYFGGLSLEDVAELLEISPATVKRKWQKARAFLFHAIRSP